LAANNTNVNKDFKRDSDHNFTIPMIATFNMKTVPVMIIALVAMATPAAAFTPRVLRIFGLGAMPASGSEISESATTFGVKKPSKELTGVDPSLTDVCATISHQIYNATSKDYFSLSDADHQADVLHFHDHGLLKDTVPPFVIAESGDALILGWRGSTTLMDWASDVSYAPVASSRWSSITQNVRAHSAYSALVESDLALYEDAIIAAVKKNKKIKQIILTGHSLAGGMAHVAHLFIEAQLSQPDNAWSHLQGKLTCRTVAFSAPMTTVNLDADHVDTATNDFLKRVADHSCNIIYNCDAVPHGVGDVVYLKNVVEDVIPDITKGIRVGPILKMMLGAPDKMKKYHDENVSKKNPVFSVPIAYHHVGNVIYYHDATADPVRLRDTTFLPKSVPEFRLYKIALPRDNKEVGAIDQLKEAHLYFPRALSYNLHLDKDGSDLTLLDETTSSPLQDTFNEEVKLISTFLVSTAESKLKDLAKKGATPKQLEDIASLVGATSKQLGGVTSFFANIDFGRSKD
jgi:hypothetical protein